MIPLSCIRIAHCISPSNGTMCREGQSPGLVADPSFHGLSVWVGGSTLRLARKQAVFLHRGACLQGQPVSKEWCSLWYSLWIVHLRELGGGRKPRHTVLPFTRGLGHRHGLDPGPGVRPWVQALGMRVGWGCPPRGFPEHTWAGASHLSYQLLCIHIVFTFQVSHWVV